MITLDAFLIFLAAASLPVMYIFLVSRWVEGEYRKAHANRDTTPVILTTKPDREAA